MILGLKMESIKPKALISIVGPKTKKARSEPLEKVETNERAKNASTVEQIDTIAAKSIIAKIEVIGLCPSPKTSSLGTNT